MSEFRLVEMCSGEVRVGEVHPTQVISGEICLSEVRQYFTVFVSPLIPPLYSLLQPCEVLLVRHRSRLLCQPPRQGRWHQHAEVT